jgi:hypothetical protein
LYVEIAQGQGSQDGKVIFCLMAVHMLVTTFELKNNNVFLIYRYYSYISL